ncbi:hypothetical protein K457DRAFT_130739 [Linnemannia elongata AG-77]|uniref:Uncharacterized protein n=1 Tax=Linnemannia elongata AG-77 TaxID=1314771 RepID=A0A197JDH0_9FUNG|nr:hypothetical protein K457DRAFT_130739 [Linnemannia elongata AG-77]
MTTLTASLTTPASHLHHQHSSTPTPLSSASRSNTSTSFATSSTQATTTTTSATTPGTPGTLEDTRSYSTAHTTNTTTTTTTTVIPLSDRIRAAEHRFTALTQNIAHFSPLKTQLDKHNLTIERIESDIKKKTAHLQACQDKLKSISKRPQTSGQGSHVSLHNHASLSSSSSEGDHPSEADVVAAQRQATKEALEALNGQLLAAKILHIGLTRQVAQYFESRGELQTLLEEHPSEDALEQELEQITTDITKVKADFERHRAAKNEFKEIRRYVDIWNDSIEKQIATNPKDASKPLKKLVPFFSGPRSPAHSSSASSSISLNSPYPGVAVGATMLDSPPDYVRDESAAAMTNNTYTAMDMGGPVALATEDEEDALFRAYRQRAGTGSLDTPPGYDETRYHTVVDPV